MSYILEALKKAEQKREREEGARPVAFSGEGAVHGKKRLLWPYFLVLALLLNAGILLLWMTPWQPEPPPREAASQPPATASASTATQPAVVPPQPVEAIKGKDLSPPAAPKSPAGERPPAAVVPRAQEPQPRPPAPEAPLPPAPPSAPLPKTAPPPNRIVSLNELPPAVRGGLPPFTVSGHAYGPDPQTRVARINERILQEGQELTPGLKVEEIIPDGIIFSFQGYKFRVGITGNR